MDLTITVESKNFEDDKDMRERIRKNPCSACMLGKGMMCVERQYCRWYSHNEIFVKKEVKPV